MRAFLYAWLCLAVRLEDGPVGVPVGSRFHQQHVASLHPVAYMLALHMHMLAPAHVYPDDDVSHESGCQGSMPWALGCRVLACMHGCCANAAAAGTADRPGIPHLSHASSVVHMLKHIKKLEYLIYVLILHFCCPAGAPGPCDPTHRLQRDCICHPCCGLHARHRSGQGMFLASRTPLSSSSSLRHHLR